MWTSDSSKIVGQRAVVSRGGQIYSATFDQFEPADDNFPEKNWLYLIEAVSGHGPFDKTRVQAMQRLFAGSTAGLVYVTAFPDRARSQKYVGVIAWETEVWVAETPEHLIHFNGDRFLGPRSFIHSDL